MSDTVQAVKERIDIADFIRGYVPLSPAGKNLKGLCPFHKEKTPSFMVSPDRQAWHCFGCSAGGDLISFLMKYENIEFFEALKILAERAGIDMRFTGGADQRQYSVLYDINQAAKEFFRGTLNSDSAAAGAAREYLKDRGLKQETIDEFSLGFAPNASDALSHALQKAGYKIQDIERAGFVFKTDRGTYWDRFRNRVMFPLENPFGKTVAFTGRIMPGAAEAETAGKYVNSPETPVFSKSKLLYGFHKTKSVIREVKTAVLVEGQMDLIMAWQDGVKNVVAASGTALTADHLRALKRLGDTIVIAYDSDEAGQAATERAIDLASASDFSVKIVRASSEMKDPADIVKSDPGAFAKLIAASEPAMHFYFRRHLGVAEGSLPKDRSDIARLKRDVRLVLQKIKNISSPVEQAHWVGRLSAITRIGEQHLFDEMRSVKTTERAGTIPAAAEEKQEARFATQRDAIEQRLIGIALAYPEYREKVAAQAEFLTEPYRRMLELASKGSWNDLPADLNELATLVSLRSSMGFGGEEDKSRELEDLLKAARGAHYKEARESVGTRIREAEQSGDEKGLKEALQEFDRLSKEIYNA